VIERGRFAATERGSPQGGVISPALFNVAVHGMEQAAGVRYYATGRDAGSAREHSPVLVRYADDFVVMCHSREQADQVKQRLRRGCDPGAWPSTRTRRASSTLRPDSTSSGSTCAAITASC
jgi:RNA-directed DNA polymerase